MMISEELIKMLSCKQ